MSAGSLPLSSFRTEGPGLLSYQAASMAGKCPPLVPSDPHLLLWKPSGEVTFSLHIECDLSPSSTHFLVLVEKLLGPLLVEPAASGSSADRPIQAEPAWSRGL